MKIAFDLDDTLIPTRKTFSSGSRRLGFPLVLIGPEDGFHPDEVAYAEEVGFTTVSLGPRILRAETAALAAVVLAQQGMGNLALC
jgi:16S rRNA (uracil1498-N3)-methyltransferase